MIYFDSSALLKFVKPAKETDALRTWRASLATGIELVTSELASLEITRTLLRAGVEHQRVPYVTSQALRGIYVVDITSTVLARARGYGIRRLGSLGAVHPATADPFRDDLTDFVLRQRTRRGRGRARPARHHSILSCASPGHGGPAAIRARMRHG